MLYRLINKYQKKHFNIVEKGSFESTIRSKIEELSLMQFVELKGRVSDEELEKEYQDADIFVMPHKELKDGDTEGCPTVFLEAGLHYLPVIGGEAGGVSDAIKNGVTGYICHKNTDELYDFLEKLINNKSLRMDMGVKGYQYASQFSTQAQSRKLKEIVSAFLKYN